MATEVVAKQLGGTPGTIGHRTVTETPFEISQKVQKASMNGRDDFVVLSGTDEKRLGLRASDILAFFEISD